MLADDAKLKAVWNIADRLSSSKRGRQGEKCSIFPPRPRSISHIARRTYQVRGTCPLTGRVPLVPFVPCQRTSRTAGEKGRGRTTPHCLHWSATLSRSAYCMLSPAHTRT